jgi:hypothetical protein
MNGPTASHENHEVTKFTKPNHVEFFVAFVPSCFGRGLVQFSNSRKLGAWLGVQGHELRRASLRSAR